MTSIETKIENVFKAEAAIDADIRSSEREDWTHAVVLRLAQRILEKERMRLREEQLCGVVRRLPWEAEAVLRDMQWLCIELDLERFFDALFEQEQHRDDA